MTILNVPTIDSVKRMSGLTKVISATAYTLTLDDLNKLLVFTDELSIALTIPSLANLDLGLNFNVEILQGAAGVITIQTENVNDTLIHRASGRSTSVVGDTARIRRLSESGGNVEYLLQGDLT